MFSYLRPHRRTPSNPTSPLPSPQPDSGQELGNHALQSNGRNELPQIDTSPLLGGPPINSPSSSSLNALTKTHSDPFQQLTGYRYEDTRQEQAPTKLTRVETWSQAGTMGEYTTNSTKARPGTAGGSVTAHGPTAPYQRPQTSITATHITGPKTGGELALILDSPPTTSNKNPVVPRQPLPLSTTSQTSFTSDFSHPRSAKARLNLLNPMSLLARRRNAQSATYPLPAPAALSLKDRQMVQNYQPIRGTRVHDFSAPRQNRVASYGDTKSADGPSLKAPGNDALQNGDLSLRVPEESNPHRWSGSSHTPVFTEDFDEEQFPAAGPHVRKANDLSDLTVPRPPYAGSAVASTPKPDIPTDATTRPTTDDQTDHSSSPQPPSLTAQPIAPLNINTAHLPSALFMSPLSVDGTSTEEQPPSSPRRRKGKGRTSRTSAKGSLSHLPKHMQSTSSRFSFDMIGAASQEKLLEDNYRQKQEQKALEKSASPEPEQQRNSMYDAGYDYDDMYDEDNGFEEEVPLVGDDYEEEIPMINGEYEEDVTMNNDDFNDELNMNGHEHLGGFTFHGLNGSAINSPLTPFSPATVATPRDANGDVIGFAVTKESPMFKVQGMSTTGAEESPSLPKEHGGAQILQEFSQQGLGSVTTIEVGDEKVKAATEVIQPLSISRKERGMRVLDDDDLYFDDGIIEHPSGLESYVFDESVFDNEDTDEFGRPLNHTLPVHPPHPAPDFAEEDIEDPQKAGHVITNDDASQLPRELSPISFETQGALAPHPSVVERPTPSDQPRPSLTHDSLTAYQTALAAAAHAAAANGRFRSDSSPSMFLSERDLQPASNGLTIESIKFNTDLELLGRAPLSPGYESGADFGYDDDLDDDAIIAEANAEALANDNDGFYGQEFGFYSAPASSSKGNGDRDGEAQYGGLFRSRAPKSISTEKARVVSREPNLTPITERSEYSARNSIMSAPLSATVSCQSHASFASHAGRDGYPMLQGNGQPGLAQLMTGDFDDGEELSLDALLKLRRGAWGGSQASLSMSGRGSSAGSSPVPQSPVGARENGAFFGGSVGDRGLGGRMSALNLLAGGVTGSISEEEEREGSGEEGAGGGSPTVTMAAQNGVMWQQDVPVPVTPPQQQQRSSTSTSTATVTPTSPHIVADATVPAPQGTAAIPLPNPLLISSLATRPMSPTSPTWMKFSPSSAALAVPSSPLFPGGTHGGPHGEPDKSRRNSSPNVNAIGLGLCLSITRKAGGASGGTSGGFSHGHRHTTSSDSISYLREEDVFDGTEGWEGGGATGRIGTTMNGGDGAVYEGDDDEQRRWTGRWVLERRRTAESGEVEILGREVVMGGRI